MLSSKVSMLSPCLASILKRLVFTFDISISILFMYSRCRVVSWDVSASLRRFSVWHIMCLRSGSRVQSSVYPLLEGGILVVSEGC